MADKHSRVCQDCTRLGKLEGWEVIPYPSNATTGPGVSDRLVCAEGYFYGVEVKTLEYPDQSDTQKLFQRRVERAGGKYFKVFSGAEMVKAIRADLLTKRVRS